MQEDDVGAIANETPVSADCTVTSSLGTEDIEDVDSDSKGTRFLKNHNSWVSSDPESAALSLAIEGGGKT